MTTRHLDPNKVGKTYASVIRSLEELEGTASSNIMTEIDRTSIN